MEVEEYGAPVQIDQSFGIYESNIDLQLPWQEPACEVPEEGLLDKTSEPLASHETK